MLGAMGQSWVESAASATFASLGMPISQLAWGKRHSDMEIMLLNAVELNSASPKTDVT